MQLYNISLQHLEISEQPRVLINIKQMTWSYINNKNSENYNRSLTYEQIDLLGCV